jgi:hypothetical protein
MGWQTKVFRFKGLEDMPIVRQMALAWRARNQHRYQIAEIFVNNGFAFEYRKLRTIY